MSAPTAKHIVGAEGVVIGVDLKPRMVAVIEHMSGSVFERVDGDDSIAHMTAVVAGGKTD